MYMVVGWEKRRLVVFCFFFLFLGMCIRHFRKEECGGVEICCRMNRYLPYKALHPCEILFFHAIILLRFDPWTYVRIDTSEK